MHIVVVYIPLLSERTFSSVSDRLTFATVRKCAKIKPSLGVYSYSSLLILHELDQDGKILVHTFCHGSGTRLSLDLLTNATVVADAIRFVSEKGAEAVANGEPKTDPAFVIEDEKQQQEDNNNKEESDNNTTTVNQVF